MCAPRACSRRRKLAAALAGSLIFSGAALAQDKPAAAPAKGAAAKDKTVAKVNGVAVPASHMDFLLQQQKNRGAPDNDQTRNIVRDELVNRELVAQADLIAANFKPGTLESLGFSHAELAQINPRIVV